jgi:hypothetical protein
MTAYRELRNEYRTTWDVFARALDEFQLLAESGESTRVKEALLAVETARRAHNSARDRLAVHLAGKKTPGKTLREIPEELRVRKTARLLWEFSGKPQGTAEKDWFTAERLVRSAASV